MTKTEIVNELFNITHEMTTDIEKAYEDQRMYSADEVMDLINYYAEKLIDLRLSITQV